MNIPTASPKLHSLTDEQQPVGTGFSQGMPTASSEEEVAAQFAGFWKKYVDQVYDSKERLMLT